MKREFALAALLVTGQAGAFDESVSMNFYDVSGATPAEIRADLNRCGVLSAGQRFSAYTAWRVSWQLHWNPALGGCAISETKVALTVTYTLPRLQGSEKLPPSEREHWTRYMESLRLHEDGHRDIGRTAARNVEEALRTMPATACDNVLATANRVGAAIIEKHAAEERRYDVITRHGATQGASYP